MESEAVPLEANEKGDAMNHYTIKLFYEFIEIEPWVNQQYDEGFEIVSIVPGQRHVPLYRRAPAETGVCRRGGADSARDGGRTPRPAGIRRHQRYRFVSHETDL